MSKKRFDVENGDIRIVEERFYPSASFTPRFSVRHFETKALYLELDEVKVLHKLLSQVLSSQKKGGNR